MWNGMKGCGMGRKGIERENRKKNKIRSVGIGKVMRKGKKRE